MRLTLGNTTLNPEKRTITVNGKVYHLANQEFTLLRRLCETPNALVNKDVLMEAMGSPNVKAFIVVGGKVRRLLEEVKSDLTIETKKMYDIPQAAMSGYILHTPDVRTITEVYTANQHAALLRCIGLAKETDPRLAALALGQDVGP